MIPSKFAYPTALLLACLGACTRTAEDAPAEDPAHPTDAPEAADAAPNQIDIPATVRSNLGLTFATVEARRVADTIRVPGAFELQPLARHEYRMALPGRVQLAARQYERVEAGQVLYRFQSPAWPALVHDIIVGEQAIATALAEIEVDRARFTEARQMLALVQERIEALAQADFKRADLELRAAELAASVPRLEAEARLAETKLANARRSRRHALHRAATAVGLADEQLEAEVIVDGEPVPAFLTIDWIEVRAVEAGVVETLAVTDGAFVEPPEAVLSTVDPERVRFRALALQSDLAALSGAVEVRIVPPRSPGLSIGERVAATMTIGLDAHPEERTLPLLATPLGSAPWIRPGVSAFLEVVVASTDGPALAIPRSAVIQDGLTHVFFRRDPGDPNRALRVEADLGVSDGRWIVVHSGLRAGDQVVLDGAYELKLATARGGAPDSGGHVHADGSSHADH